MANLRDIREEVSVRLPFSNEELHGIIVGRSFMEIPVYDVRLQDGQVIYGVEELSSNTTIVPTNTDVKQKPSLTGRNNHPDDYSQQSTLQSLGPEANTERC